MVAKWMDTCPHLPILHPEHSSGTWARAQCAAPREERTRGDGFRYATALGGQSMAATMASAARPSERAGRQPVWVWISPARRPRSRVPLVGQPTRGTTLGC